jgi:hypothetical protein
LNPHLGPRDEPGPEMESRRLRVCCLGHAADADLAVSRGAARHGILLLMRAGNEYKNGSARFKLSRVLTALVVRASSTLTGERRSCATSSVGVGWGASPPGTPASAMPFAARLPATRTSLPATCSRTLLLTAVYPSCMRQNPESLSPHASATPRQSLSVLQRGMKCFDVDFFVARNADVRSQSQHPHVVWRFFVYVGQFEDRAYR